MLNPYDVDIERKEFREKNIESPENYPQWKVEHERGENPNAYDHWLSSPDAEMKGKYYKSGSRGEHRSSTHLQQNGKSFST